MRITSLLKSINRSLPISLGMDSSDDSYSSGSDSSNDSADSGANATSKLLNASRPVLPAQYVPSTPGADWGYESNIGDEDAALSTYEILTYLISDMSNVQDETDRHARYQHSSDPFMLENEDLKSQLATQNPWRTLARYRNPFKNKDLGLGTRFPLLSLPVEILLLVVGHLPAESAACLALACKTTYSTLENTSFKMSKSDLWKFLLLIEHERQNSYACSRCLTLHRPPETTFYSRYRCVWDRSLMSQFQVKFSLPETITPGLVKMIGRKWLEDPTTHHEYLSWAIMTEKKTTRYIKLATHVIPRMLDGSLVLRTETYIHVLIDGHLTERSLIELAAHTLEDDDSIHTSIRVPDVCGHQKWAPHLTNLTRLKKQVKPTKCVLEDNPDNPFPHFHLAQCYSNERIMRTSHGLEYPIGMCDLIHRQPCFTYKIQKPTSTARTLKPREAREASMPKLEDTYDGDIMGCRKCITDFCVSACEVPGLGFCLVLTTWKDLGGVGVGFSDKWDLHIRTSRLHYDYDDLGSEDQVGQAYEAFEKLERSYLGTPQQYRPQPDRKMIRDLTRRVYKSADRIDRDDTTDGDAETDFEVDEADL